LKKKHAQKLEDERRRIESEKTRIEEELLSERALVADTQEILRRSKQREQEMEDQLDSFMSELEEADNNYDKLMDSFADSQRTVERMRAELTLGAQLVQKLQEEKLQLLEEIEEVSKENIVKIPDEEQLEHIRQLYIHFHLILILVRKTSLILKWKLRNSKLNYAKDDKQTRPWKGRSMIWRKISADLKGRNRKLKLAPGLWRMNCGLPEHKSMNCFLRISITRMLFE
jgi:myosin protein heavy chain